MVRVESKNSENLILAYQHISSESGNFKEQILILIKRRSQGEKAETINSLRYWNEKILFP